MDTYQRKETSMRTFLFLLCILSFSALSAPQMDKEGWLPFVLTNGAVLIEIEVAGKPATALIDSGSEINGISRSYVDANKAQLSFGERIRLKGVVGEEELAMVTAFAVSIFGQQTRFSDLVPMQFGESVLLLGQPFLRNFIVQFDYPRQKIRLLPHAAVDMNKVANLEVKQGRGRNLPAIKVDIAKDESLWLTLDTGNTGGLLVTRQTAESQGWLKSLPSIKHDVSGVVGDGQAETFQIPYLKIGPYELEGVFVTIPAEGQQMNITDKTSRLTAGVQKGIQTKGLLGYDILKHFVLTLDTKNWHAHIAAP